MESLTDPVGLRMPGLRAGVIDVLGCEIQFVLMALRRPAALRAAIGEDPVERNSCGSLPSC